MSDADKTREQLIGELAELRERVDGLERAEAEVRQAEEALRKNEEKYRSLFTEVGYGFSLNEMIFDEAGAPSDYVTLEINRAFEQILAVSEADVVGRKASEILPHDELRKWVEIFGEVIRSDSPVRCEIFSRKNNKGSPGGK